MGAEIRRKKGGEGSRDKEEDTGKEGSRDKEEERGGAELGGRKMEQSERQTHGHIRNHDNETRQIVLTTV